MTCENKLQELNVQRPCWLPKDPMSPFDLCSRCNYYRVEETLSKIYHGDFTGISILQDTNFQLSCAKKEHCQSLLAVFTALCEKKQPSVSTLLDLYLNHKEFKCKDFEQTLKYQSRHHTSSNRCCLYRQYLKHRTSEKRVIATDVPPVNCWSCMAWILRQKNILGFYEAFIIVINSQRIQSLIKESNTNDIVDMMVSLEIKEKPHLVRTLFNTYRICVKNDEAKKALVQFFSQPATVSLLFTEKAIHYIPPSLLYAEDTFLQQLQKEALANIRKRNWIFKEELMIRTWAPEHMVPWCFDIEERKEFEELERD